MAYEVSDDKISLANEAGYIAYANGENYVNNPFDEAIKSHM